MLVACIVTLHEGWNLIRCCSVTCSLAAAMLEACIDCFSVQFRTGIHFCHDILGKTFGTATDPQANYNNFIPCFNL